jgi:type I restriction enzyme S subunit
VTDIAALVAGNLTVWTGAIERRSGGGRGGGKRISLYGIERLRVLIRDLAVAGKLVPQDPRDESASVLMKRVSKVAAQSGLKPKYTPLGADDGFKTPSGWCNVRLAQLANSQAGFAFKSRGFNEQGMGPPLIRIRDVGQPFTGTFFNGDYREEFVVTKGDYLISMDGEFRVAVWPGPDGLLNQRVSRLQFYSHEIEQSYVAMALQKQLTELQGIKAYTTVDHLSGKQIADVIIPLPPLAEQKRIVAKVSELFALCGRLEEESAAALDVHQRLVECIVATLVDSCDATDLAANWSRVEAHFDILFATEESIEALKRTVLELAVRGRLVAQDVRDEPARKLIALIHSELRTKKMDGGKVKIAKVTTKPFDIPDGWEWDVFENLIDPKYPISYGVLVPGDHEEGGVPFVRIADLSLTNPAPLPSKSISSQVDAEFARTRLSGGEILMGVVGSIGKLGIAPKSWEGANIARAICRIVPTERIIKDYIVWLLQSEFMQNSFKDDTRTLAQPTLNLGLIRTSPIPLPPLAEQQRIVTKVSSLMALCDSVKTALAEASETQKNLADAVVERASA